MRKMLIAGAMLAAALSPARAESVGPYAVGSYVPFWYIDQPGADLIEVSGRIKTIHDPDSPVAKMYVAGCVRITHVRGQLRDPVEPCHDPVEATKGLKPWAEADCVTGQFQTLSGSFFLFKPAMGQEDVMLDVVDLSTSSVLKEGPRLWAAREQFRAMCPGVMGKYDE